MDLLTALATAAWPLRWWALTLAAGTVLILVVDTALHPRTVGGDQ